MMARCLRRRLRLNMRTAMILVAVLGTVLGWLAHGANTQRDAVAAIRRAGGRVVYDGEPRAMMPGQKQNAWSSLRLRYRALGWLVDRVGIDYFDHPAHVSLPAQSRLDEAMAHVGRLRRLDRLFIDGRDSANISLGPLEGMAELKVLVVRNAKIGAAGLTPLRGLKNLRCLDLIHVGLTDAGLDPIERLVNLVELNLEENNLTGAGLARLSRLTQLQQLNLGDSFRDPAGAALPDLQQRLPRVRIAVGNGVYGENW